MESKKIGGKIAQGMSATLHIIFPTQISQGTVFNICMFCIVFLFLLDF
jgi:hypothetical protein